MRYVKQLLTSLAIAAFPIAGSPTPDDLVSLDITVVDSEGNPIAGVWIAARHGERGELWPQVPQEEQFLALAKSDELGSAILSGIPLNPSIEVGVWGNGWALSTRRIDSEVLLTEERLATHFILELGRDVQLRALDFEGFPVADAEVRLRVGQVAISTLARDRGDWRATRPVMRGFGYYNGYEQFAKTDAMGRITFAAVPFEVGELRWQHRGFVNCGTQELNPVACDATIQADPGGVIHGKVLRSNWWSSAIGARISVHSQIERPAEIGMGVTEIRNPIIPDDVRAIVEGDDGEFRITGLPLSSWYYLQIEFQDVIFKTPWRHTDCHNSTFVLPRIPFIPDQSNYYQ